MVGNYQLNNRYVGGLLPQKEISGLEYSSNPWINGGYENNKNDIGAFHGPYDN